MKGAAAAKMQDAAAAAAPNSLGFRRHSSAAAGVGDPKMMPQNVARPGAVAQARASLVDPLDGFGPEAPRGPSDLEPSPRQEGPRRLGSSGGAPRDNGLEPRPGSQQQQQQQQQQQEPGVYMEGMRQEELIAASGLPGMMQDDPQPLNRPRESARYGLGMAQQQGVGARRSSGEVGVDEEGEAAQLGSRVTATPLSQEQQLQQHLQSGGSSRQGSDYGVAEAAGGSSTRSASVQPPQPTTAANRLRKARANKVLPIAEEYRGGSPGGLDEGF